MIVLNKIENIPNLYDLFDVIAHLTILSEGMNMFEILVELFRFPVGKEPEQKLIHLAHRTFSIFIQYQSWSANRITYLEYKYQDWTLLQFSYYFQFKFNIIQSEFNFNSPMYV